MISDDHMKFLADLSQHRKQCINYVRRLLCEEFFGQKLSDLSIPDQRTMEEAATHVMTTFNYAGWDLMFDEDGKYMGMIT